MGYSHGKLWSDVKLKEEILKVINILNINRMPTVTELKNINKGGLACAIGKHGGYEHWGNMLNLGHKKSETGLGLYYEKYFMSHVNYNCEKMSTKFPYDILVEKCVKIDVKCGFLYHGKQGNFYTFNLENKNARCDLYSCFCLNKDGDITKKYIIPAIIMQDKTQISIGEFNSKYDTYKNNFNLLQEYINFYNGIKNINTNNAKGI
jgi:hypothetical protein